MEHEPGRGQGMDRGRSSAQVRHQSGNNNVYPSDWTEGSRDTLTYGKLDESAREALLLDKGYLFGVRIDSNDGPMRSTRQVAQRTSASPLQIRETNNIDSQVFTTENARDTNYVHRGWSPAAISHKSPWASSRIARNNQMNLSTKSITKYVMIQKLRIDLLREDLSPVPEFEDAVKAALGRPTRFKKSQEVYRIFEQWGDVIPLVFDLGISLAVTDLEVVARDYLKATDRSYFGLQQLSMSLSARPSTLGGDPTTLQSEDNIKEWLRRPVPSHLWEQVQVVKVAHITTILSNELQTRLAELHQSLTTYCPTTTSAITSNGSSFDGAAHASKTISKVAFYSDGYHIKSIFVEYTTEISRVKYGVPHATNSGFDLMTGERITDVLIWKDYKGVCGIQLNTNQGRTSPHFGSDSGSPAILRSTGGCLSGFSGIVQNDIIHELRTIWRHDVQGVGIGGDRVLSPYYGGLAGASFSDWPSVQHSDTSYITSIRVKSGTYVDGIQASHDYHLSQTKQPYSTSSQITYKDSVLGGLGSVTSQANYHGGAGGTEHIFELKPNEHIVAVLGRYNKYIVQLCFVTNRGRTSNIFGGGDGEDFRCQAPETSDGRATRLHYICGKSGDWLNGIMLVWAPL